MKNEKKKDKIITVTLSYIGKFDMEKLEMYPLVTNPDSEFYKDLPLGVTIVVCGADGSLARTILLGEVVSLPLSYLIKEDTKEKEEKGKSKK